MFIGIPVNVMQSYWSPQERQDYCWGACVQMVLRLYEVVRSQGEIDFKGNGPNLLDLFPDRSGHNFSIEYNINEPSRRICIKQLSDRCVRKDGRARYRSVPLFGSGGTHTT
jgi:hypothetical protein